MIDPNEPPPPPPGAEISAGPWQLDVVADAAAPDEPPAVEVEAGRAEAADARDETELPPPLERLLEALLFAGGKQLTAERAAGLIRGLTPVQFRAAIDTLNRTFLSKLVAIKIWQEWKSTAFMPPNLHEWRMFVRPEELKGLLVQSGFEFREFRGTSPNVSIPAMISLLRKRAKGKIGYKELGQKFRLVESRDINILYMGYAVKPPR